MHNTARVVVLALATLGSFMLAAPAGAQIVAPCSRPGDKPTDLPKVVPNYSAGEEALAAGNLRLAVAHLRPLAEDGNAKAQSSLGEILLRGGCGVTADKPEGAKWLRKSAEAHDSTGEYLYSQALMDGDGVDPDDKAAFDWARRAGKAGVPQAQVSVGYFYFAGRGVKQDYKQGIRWTVMAGEQGAPVGLSNLAKCYLQGNGVPKDLHRAMFFISLAMQRVPPMQWQMTQRFTQTRYAIARGLSVEDTKKIEQDSEKWSPGKGSLADVLADSEKWTPTADISPAEVDVAYR